jgi:hypothetical protein
VKFVAGIVDDPFFFDITAFAAFVESVRQHALDPNVPVNAAAFGRGRDTFAGYNCLSIALELSVDMLKGTNGNIIGLDFDAQRHNVQQSTANGTKGVGAFKTVDRMGNPAINVALIGFNKKDSYNGSSPKADAGLGFAISNIIPTLTALGVDTHLTPPLNPNFAALAQIAVLRGDILQLDTTLTNGGNRGGTTGSSGFGKPGASGEVAGGRRLADDTIDIILSTIAGGPLGDNVALDQDGFVPGDTFPYLHTPHQPLPRNPADPTQPDTNVDDGTRN